MENIIPVLENPAEDSDEDYASSNELDAFGVSNMISQEQIPEDYMIKREELEKMKVECNPEDGSEAEKISEEMGSRTSNLFESEDGSIFNVRQIAAVLLSDTSDSENDGDEGLNQFCDVNTQKIQEEMYNEIQTQIKKQLVEERPFTKCWIEQQRTMYLKWKKEQELGTHFDEGRRKENNENSIAGTLLLDSLGEIPQVTELTGKPHFSRKQIEEEMGKMDKEKRERWEKIFIQLELRKSMRAPVLKSDIRKDFKRMQNSNGQDGLVEYYRTALGNLKEDVRMSVVKLEQIMSALEAKEQMKSQGSHHQSSNVEVVQDDIIDLDEKEQKAESAEISSASEDEFLTEKEIDEYEELLSKNVLVAPNIQKIQELLDMKIVFPEPVKEIVQLGCSLKEVEQNLLESKGLKSYISRIVYFYVYRSNHNAESIKAAYEEIVGDVRIAKELESSSNKGCLLIYENVSMAIVMVEGPEFEILKHLSKFKSSLLSAVKRGKVLYIHRSLLKMYFNKWVTRVENPPAGKITYLTKSKKVLYRTAASRVVRTSEMLHKLYRHVSKEERYLVDPRSIYIKSKYLVMLPSPAMFAYLLKYNILRDLRRFIDEIGKPFDLSSDDEELFAFTEDVMYSNYIDSDQDDEIITKKLNYVKDTIKQAGVGKKENVKELNDIKIKETGESVSWDSYVMDDISATIIDNRIKLSEDTEHPAIRLASAVEAQQSSMDEDNRKCLFQDDYFNDNRSKHELLTFLEKGTERWYNKMKWHGVNFRQSVEKQEENLDGGSGHELDDERDDLLPSVEETSGDENLDFDESFSDTYSDSTTSNQNEYEL